MKALPFLFLYVLIPLTLQAGGDAYWESAYRVTPPSPQVPGVLPKGYRFRGDGPVEVEAPASQFDYHYRPLRVQERDRSQATTGWRPLTVPRQEPLPPPLPSLAYPPADWQPGGEVQGLPLNPERPGSVSQEPDNWFQRHYGERRR